MKVEYQNAARDVDEIKLNDGAVFLLDQSQSLEPLQNEPAPGPSKKPHKKVREFKAPAFNEKKRVKKMLEKFAKWESQFGKKKGLVNEEDLDFETIGSVADSGPKQQKENEQQLQTKPEEAEQKEQVTHKQLPMKRSLKD